MKEFDLSSGLRNESIRERRLMTMVETINQIDSSVGVQSYRVPSKKEYDCIEWDTKTDKVRFTESYVLQQQLQKTKELWAIILMEEANALQQRALSLHTISQQEPLHQKELYDQKYTAASEYVSAVTLWQHENSTGDFPSVEQVSVPDIIYEEGSRTGDPLYYLCLAIIQNYKSTQDTLKKFYGQVEGERRVTKKRILACANITELQNVAWANWPNYIGDPPSPAD